MPLNDVKALQQAVQRLRNDFDELRDLSGKRWLQHNDQLFRLDYAFKKVKHIGSLTGLIACGVLIGAAITAVIKG